MFFRTTDNISYNNNNKTQLKQKKAQFRPEVCTLSLTSFYIYSSSNDIFLVEITDLLFHYYSITVGYITKSKQLKLFTYAEIHSNGYHWKPWFIKKCLLSPFPTAAFYKSVFFK